MKKYILMSLAAVVMLMSSCSKTYLDTVPTGSVGNPIVFESVDNIEKALMGAYAHMAFYYIDNSNRILWNMNVRGDITAGILVRTNNTSTWFWDDYTFEIFNSNTSRTFWFHYRYMYLILKELNAVIYYGDKLEVTGESAEKRDFIVAEAKGLRAYCYDKLAIFFSLRPKEGHDNSQLCVPLIIDPTETEKQPRATLAEVLTQINKDLDEAEDVLATNTFTPTYQKGPAERFNLDAVRMLKARVAMYTFDYATGLEYAKKVADKYDIMGVESYYEGFNDMTNDEWIFSVSSNTINFAYYGSLYAYLGSNFKASFYRTCPMAIDTRYLNAIPDTDRRIKEADGTIGMWITGTQADVDANGLEYYFNEDFLPELRDDQRIYPGMSRKYKTTNPETNIGCGDYPYMRGAEAYYIVAEAALLTGDLPTAKTYLEAAVQPYDPTFKAANNIDDVMEQVVLYKIFDLYGEGQGFEDFKRRGNIISRSGSNHPAECMVYTYGPKEDQPRNDVFTYPMPIDALENNSLLNPVNKY